MHGVTMKKKHIFKILSSLLQINYFNHPTDIIAVILTDQVVHLQRKGKLIENLFFFLLT